jgi:hypothetical protein
MLAAASGADLCPHMPYARCVLAPRNDTAVLAALRERHPQLPLLLQHEAFAINFPLARAFSDAPPLYIPAPFLVPKRVSFTLDQAVARVNAKNPFCFPADFFDCATDLLALFWTSIRFGLKITAPRTFLAMCEHLAKAVAGASSPAAHIALLLAMRHLNPEAVPPATIVDNFERALAAGTPSPKLAAVRALYAPFTLAHCAFILGRAPEFSFPLNPSPETTTPSHSFAELAQVVPHLPRLRPHRINPNATAQKLGHDLSILSLLDQRLLLVACALL